MTLKSSLIDIVVKQGIPAELSHGVIDDLIDSISRESNSGPSIAMCITADSQVDSISIFFLKYIVCRTNVVAKEWVSKNLEIV
jgi:hypothetical protein